MILAVFVWQQPAEQPQGHANERKAFQHRGGVVSSHGYQSSERERDQQGRGASGVREVNLAGIPQQQIPH